MRDSVRSASYSSVCNVLRQWNIRLIPTYRVYRLYDTYVCIVKCVYGISCSWSLLLLHNNVGSVSWADEMEGDALHRSSVNALRANITFKSNLHVILNLEL